ncbi:hypothetical protein [Flavobacterium sp.]|jgi:predicted NUDIX family phosphoesterase|uniref:hypothetical protein n=1 Tax=Flavobacterium sp. TaxID=239 RepID=UPI0037BF947B
MTKQTLCIRNVGELEAVMTGKAETIATFMVPRAVCEIKSDTQPFKQLIPYVSFNALDEQGTLMHLAYSRPSTGSEERLHDDTSVGFGGHMDDLADLTSSIGPINGETLVEAYPGVFYPYIEMTKQDLIASIYKAGRREVTEELGQDLFEKLNINVDNVNMMVIQDPEPDSVGQVHLCIAIIIDLPSQQLVEMKNELVETKSVREVANLRVFGIGLDSVMKGGVEPQINQLVDDLKKTYQFERWSILIAVNRLAAVFNFVYGNVQFSDVFQLAVRNAHQRAEQERLQAEQKAAEGNLAQSQVLGNEVGDGDQTPEPDTGPTEITDRFN